MLVNTSISGTKPRFIVVGIAAIRNTVNAGYNRMSVKRQDSSISISRFLCPAILRFFHSFSFSTISVGSAVQKLHHFTLNIFVRGVRGRSVSSHRIYKKQTLIKHICEMKWKFFKRLTNDVFERLSFRAQITQASRQHTTVKFELMLNIILKFKWWKLKFAR